jgi:broad specificity phosphatase PhoE
LLQARQTAEIVRKALPSAEYGIDDELCEIQPGAAEGLNRSEYRDLSHLSP